MWSAIFAEPISEDSFYLLYEDGMVQKYSLDNGELAETLE